MRPPRGLGELALRVNDLERMRNFYTEVVGLEPFDETIPDAVFLKVADAAEGHPQLLVLFDRKVDVAPGGSTLDHFAFLIEPSEHEVRRRELEALGVPVLVREFPHFGWRGLFFMDPEGNTVEFVSYDPELGPRSA